MLATMRGRYRPWIRDLRVRKGNESAFNPGMATTSTPLCRRMLSISIEASHESIDGPKAVWGALDSREIANCSEQKSSR